MTRRHLTTLVLALCLPLMIHCTGDKDTDTDTDTDTDVESDPISEAFTDPESYRDTFFVTPNGNCVLSSPMLRSMLGAGEEIFGGGEFAKVGCSTGMFYARMTDGIDNDYQFHVLRAPENRTNTLPPDVTSLGDLPELITDNLPP